MTKRTRLFVAIAAGILVVGLGTGLLASYMGVQNLTLIGGNGPAEFAYVPADTQVLGFANVRAVMDSEVRRKLMELHPGAANADQFQERTGINIETDIDSVLAAVATDTFSEKSPPLVLARGRFDQVRLEGFARDEGGVVEDYKGKRLITHDNFAVAFVEPGLVALGGPAAVRRAIDTKLADAGNVTANAELMQLVKDIDDGTVWGVARFDSLTGYEHSRRAQVQDPRDQLVLRQGPDQRRYRGAVCVSRPGTKSAAQDLRQVIQGFVALGRMQVGPEHPEISDFIASLQLTGQGKTVSLGFSVPSAMIDVLTKLRAAQARPKAPAPSLPELQELPELPVVPAPPAL